MVNLQDYSMATPFFGKRDTEIPTTGVRPGARKA